MNAPSDAELPSLTCGEGSAMPPIPKERSFSAPQFRGFSCLQNDRIRHGNTHGEGLLISSAKPPPQGAWS